MKTFPIYIEAINSISALGNSSEEVLKSYKNEKPLFTVKDYKHFKNAYVSCLSESSKYCLEEIKRENKFYASLDDSVLLAIFSARKTLNQLNWKKDFGVNIGSSRGATGLFEKYHEEFITTGNTSALASPTTTLGNISSWVLQDQQSKGPEMSHSITCSTAMHSVLNGIAWIKSGMSDQFLVGGSEAPLTDFTLAQMKALKLYASFKENEVFPNKSLDFSKDRNTMILGEACCTIALSGKKTKKAIAKITGIGYATESLTHNISISPEADCLQTSMRKALDDAQLTTVDAVIMHAPGTKKGDTSELKAIENLFKKEMPLLTSNKFMIGHSFGASGAMSLEMAVLMLQHQQFFSNPMYNNNFSKKELKNIMVNAVGFGGNAVSIIVSV